MSQVILLMSGPNLDRLGERDPEVYGTATLADLVSTAAERARRAGFEVEHFQSNDESRLIETVHAARGRVVAIIINPGALTHYSWALRDALDIFDGPVVELHLSNPAAREPFRHRSTIAGVVDGTIAGFGPLGYALAVDAVLALVGA